MYKIDDVNYMVSLYCPGKCAHCNIWKYGKNIIKNEIDISLFEKTLQSNVLKNAKYFDLTAGESQLSPKYIEAVKIIATYKNEALIHTNISGWYPKKHYEITKKALEYTKKLRIDISFDGSEENYKKIRLVKNGYKKVLETIELLKKLDIHLRLTMIVYKENYKDIPFVVDFAKKNDLDYYIGYARNANLLKNLDKRQNYTNEELEEIEEMLKDIGWLNKRRMANWLWAKSIYQNNIPFFNCFMGEKALVIDPYGNVFPCNECLEFLNMGNLKDFNGDLDKLLYSKKALEIIKKIENKECQPCSMLCAHKIEFPWGKQSGMI